MASSFKSYASSSIGTSNTTIFTATTSTTVIGFSIANVSDNAITASAILSKSVGGTSSYIVKNAPVPLGGTLVIVGGDQKIVMEVSDTLKVNASNTAHTIISTLEIS